MARRDVRSQHAITADKIAEVSFSLALKYGDALKVQNVRLEVHIKAKADLFAKDRGQNKKRRRKLVASSFEC